MTDGVVENLTQSIFRNLQLFYALQTLIVDRHGKELVFEHPHHTVGHLYDTAFYHFLRHQIGHVGMESANLELRASKIATGFLAEQEQRSVLQATFVIYEIQVL